MHRTKRTFKWLPALCAIASLALADPAKQFDIPAQPLSQALMAFSEQSELVVTAATTLLAGKQAPAVRGTMEPEEALRLLLEGSGLKYSKGPGGEMTILPTAQAGSSASEEAESQTAKGVPEILVKGSRVMNTDIRRTEDDAQPYIVFSGEEIARSGAANLDDFLRTRLPMNAQQGTSSQFAVDAASLGGGIDLRGLGSAQTLILIDGRRVPGTIGANFNGIRFNQFNISGIPPAAVERIEVLPATASGIYGGSATGGVVNIIMKKNYAGLDAQLTYGNTLDDDVSRTEASISGGFTLENGRTRIMLGASRSEQSELRPGDRDFLRRGRELTLRNNPNAINADFFPVLGYTPNICSGLELFPGFFGCGGPNLVLDSGTALGSSVASVPAGYAGPAGDGGAALAGTAGRFNLDPAANTGTLFQAPETQSATANIRRDFGRRLEAFLDLSGDRTVNSGRSTNGLTVTLPASSPDNPFQQPIVVALATPNLATPRDTEMENIRARAGLIARLPRGWTVSLEQGWAQGTSEGSGRNSVSMDAAGDAFLQTIALRDPNAFPPDLTPYQAFITTDSGPFENVLTDTTLRLSGPAVRLPAGPLTVSGLIERRKEQQRDSFDEIIQPSFTFLSWFPSNTQEVRAAYVEARAPLFSPAQAVPLVRELELMASVRREKYESRTVPDAGYFLVHSRQGPFPDFTHVLSDGESDDYTLGLRYAPTPDIALRASFGTGFLPPNLGQLSPSISLAIPAQFFGIADPERGNSAFTENVTLIQGGDSSILPEHSESVSYGLVLTPRRLEALRFSADYTRIKKSDEIRNPPIVFMLNNADRYPGRVVRGPNLPGDPPGWAGPVVGLDISALNVATTVVEAYDFQLDYELKTRRFGNWRPYAVATRQTHLERRFFPDQDPFDTVGMFDGPLKWRANIGLSWSGGPWTLGWDTQYYSSYSLRFGNPALAAVGNGSVANQGSDTISSQTYSDVFVACDFAGAEITLAIHNFFNQRPPIVASLSSDLTGGYSNYGDPRLRRFALMLRKHFGVR